LATDDAGVPHIENFMFRELGTDSEEEQDEYDEIESEDESGNVTTDSEDSAAICATCS
jgi:hypothetical protein